LKKCTLAASQWAASVNSSWPQGQKRGFLMKRLSLAVLGLAAVFAALTSVGCATKKYVRETIPRCRRRLRTSRRRTPRRIAPSRTWARGCPGRMSAPRAPTARLEMRAREAARANDQAALASKQAGAAQSTADKGVAQATQAERSVGTLGNRVENMDQLQTCLDRGCAVRPREERVERGSRGPTRRLRRQSRSHEALHRRSAGVHRLDRRAPRPTLSSAGAVRLPCSVSDAG